MKKLTLIVLTFTSISGVAAETTDFEKAIRYSQVVQAAKTNHNNSQACVAQTGMIEALKNTNMLDALEIAKKEQVTLCKVFNYKSL